MQDPAPDTDKRLWHVLYLHPRTEKKVAEHCRFHSLPHYLPLRRETKIYQRRKVTVEKPVFPGYCFVAFDRETRVTLLQCNHVVRILMPVSQRILLHQLAQIRRALKANPELNTTRSLDRGTRVRITTGPFMGVEGLVADVKASGRVFLNVDLVGQAVVVEVERGFLEIEN